SVDCYIPTKNLVLEVNGPSHYSLDGSLNVKSVKQAELIKKLGFKYQVISYKDWDALEDDAEKKAFIKNLMPSQLNVSASVFRPSNCLDPNAIAFNPRYKI
ncbi:MAG: RAP domain-containing protein, partial [Pseudomonadota bacterium]|nr:RAP domain-containing protein [Pseudomonadota bacterium]